MVATSQLDVNKAMDPMTLARELPRGMIVRRKTLQDVCGRERNRQKHDALVFTSVLLRGKQGNGAWVSCNCEIIYDARVVS